MCFLWGADLRLWHSWQMSIVQDPRKTWLATGNLLTVWWEIQSLGLRLQQPFAFWLWVLSAWLSASREEGPYMAASLLSFGISWILVLWACQGSLWGLRAFHRKVFFFFFLISLTIPRFGLLSHISSLRLFSWYSGLVLTLRTDDAAHTSLPSPHSFVVDTSIWANSLLAIVVGSIFCGVLFILYYWLCCLLRFQNYTQTHLWEVFLLLGIFSSFPTPSPAQVSVPKYFVSVFMFYILSYLLLKRKGCLSGCLFSSARVQNFFCVCGSYSTFKWSCDEFVGDKLVSLCYFFTILGLSPSPCCFDGNFPND